MPERVRIAVGSGAVHVIGEARDAVAVDGAAFSVTDGETAVRGDSDSFTVRVPSGTDVIVGSRSGDITLDGVLGAVSVTTDSADVRAADVASIDARTASGQLRVEVSRGAVRLRARSATVKVGRVDGPVRVAAESGDINIDEARGAVSLKTVSGDIKVTVTGRDAVSVETVSGDMTVKVPDGVKPDVRPRSVSGKHRISVDAGDDLVIVTRSVSGDVVVGVA
jgi:DUF4097 and DUF4098 domain-containing protein YvlB